MILAEANEVDIPHFLFCAENKKGNREEVRKDNMGKKTKKLHVSPIAHPLADKSLTKKILKLNKKGFKNCALPVNQVSILSDT